MIILKFSFFGGGNDYLLKHKPAPTCHLAKIILLSELRPQLTLHRLRNLFSLFFQKLLIVETRLEAFLEDINKVISMKKFYSNLS